MIGTMPYGHNIDSTSVWPNLTTPLFTAAALGLEVECWIAEGLVDYVRHAAQFFSCAFEALS